MRLLMITRKVDRNDASPAGFTYTWVKKIGEKLDKLYVITWQKSDRGDLPKNIEIISLFGGKFFKIFSLQFKLLKVLPKIDGVFCHQNPEYTILSAFLAKLFRKKTVSWYTHKEINLRRRLVELLADKILTASNLSFRKPFFPNKIEVTGHGIDTEHFYKFRTKENDGKFKIVSVGRISPIKNYETLIEAIDILINQREIKNIEVQIIGGPVLKREQKYFEGLQQMVKDKGLREYIQFLGPVPHNQVLSCYQNCDLFVNLSQTGSVDKAVLEAMACETLILTSNEAFKDILKDKRLTFRPNDSHNLTDKIINLMNLSNEEKQKISQSLRNEVVDNHNLDKLVGKILVLYK